MAELLINNKDAKTFSMNGEVRMGSGFVDALLAPVVPKAYVENNSRLENGKKVIIANTKVASREVTLTFNLHAASASKLVGLRNDLMAQFNGQLVKIKVPDISNDIYRLLFKKSVSFGSNPQHTICKIMCNFEEVNPAIRNT